MIWALDFDDFNNICSYGKYPLSTVMKKTLEAAEAGVSVTPPSTHIPLSTMGSSNITSAGSSGTDPDSGIQGTSVGENILNFKTS